MSSVKVFNSLKEFVNYRDSISPDVSIGFVPTMGALHNGHVSLMKKSAEENDLSVLSIFVNPTQFNNAEDLKKYPRSLESDLKIAEEADIQFVLLPTYEEIYPDAYRYQIIENDFSKKLCGAHREGHFNGVLTIVMKLLQILAPHNAYFGKKDFQQFKLIEDMAQAFFLRTRIIGCETIRENDGLAMSSRNVRLSQQGRETAPLIYKALTTIKNLNEASEFLTTNKIEVEYLEEHYGRRFIAAHVDGVRLIDNVECK
jgi:pantoate--beta-alanine ligase